MARRRKRNAVVPGIMLLIVGIATIAVGIYAGYVKNDFKNNAKKTTAYVNSVDSKDYKTTYYKKRKPTKKKNRKTTTKTEYYAYVTYEVDGKEYSNIKLEDVSSGLSAGDKITIYYDERNPTRIDDHMLEPQKTTMIVASGGVFFILFGIFTLRRR